MGNMRSIWLGKLNVGYVGTKNCETLPIRGSTNLVKSVWVVADEKIEAMRIAANISFENFIIGVNLILKNFITII
jgi:hypothetical protein